MTFHKGLVAGAVAFTLFGLYIGWRALKGDERDALVRSSAVAFAATGGTNFQGANLTDAIFTRATLKNTDFRKAILTRTGFRKAKKLDLARPGNTYLKSLQLQKWLIGIGQDNNFDRFNLRGVNFQGQILTDASFIGADLSEANLQDADLSRAKLVPTQLDGTDFTGATLTGAYIEDWGITVDTNLHGVRCDYIFMRLPPKERPHWLPLPVPVEANLDPNPRRKPDNWNEEFENGQFENFIKPLQDTLDLYHNKPINHRAIAIALQQLAEKHPESELEVVALEKRGEGDLLIRAATAEKADRSQMSEDYLTDLNQLKSLSSEKLIFL